MFGKAGVAGIAALLLGQGSIVGARTPAIDERGAVYCSYSIVTTLEAYARNCGQSGTKSHASLVDLLDLHRNFVARNRPASEEELDAFEAQQTQPLGATCKDQSLVEFYNAVASQMPSFEKEIEDSLSVDREPVWNPCL